MKKTIYKIIIVLMISVMVLAYVCPLVSMAKTNYTNYLALGDSIAYGYGLTNRDEESYSQRLRKKYNIGDNNFRNLAISGMTCAEFYNKIQEENYTNTIKKADLITISIGSNELLGLVTKTVSEVTGIPEDDANFVTKVQNLLLSAGILKKMELLSTIYDKFTSEEMKVEIDKAVESYNTNWKKSVQYIKSINPNVQIVATEFYNPYYEIALGSYDLGGFVDENIQKLNKILIEQSNSEQEYKIAKIYEAFNTTNPRLTNVNVSMSNLNVDPHPNTLGHEVICTKIIDALSTVEQDKKDIAKLTINELKTQNYTGQELRPEVVVKDGNTTLTQDKDYTVSYSQNVEIGEAKVTIIGIGNYSGKVIKTFNIKNKEEKDISNLNISDIQDQIYLGIKVTPDVTIKDGDAELKKNVDYELSYENNIDVGEAKIIIRGVGNYTSSVTKNFKIVAKDIKNVTVQDITDQVYTGTAIEPNVSVMDGSTKLVENKDYTVAYENNVEKGNATIKLAGKGNYTGSIKKEFNIVQETEDTAKDIATLPIDNIENKIYTGKLITPELRIKDGENILEKNKDYTIKYIDNLNVGTATATIKGIGKYKGQVNKTFEIVKKDINYTMILDLPNQTYTGKEIVPQVTIESDGIVLQEGKDYSLKYINNTNVGTATIEIEGTGNYTNKATKTFNIVEISKNNTEQNNENQSENNENANKSNSGLPSRLPKAGISTIIISALFVMIIISVTLYKWLKHNRDIKI